MNDTFVAFAGAVVLLVALVFGLVSLSAYKCESQWARSGLKAEWALAQGCLVQRKDGTWVPASAIRDVAQ